MNKLNNIELTAARIDNANIHNTNLDYVHLLHTFVHSGTSLHINGDTYVGDELQKLLSFLRTLHKQHHPEDYV